MPRFKLLIEYNGTRFRGWQKQEDAKTVQGILLDACKETFETRRVDLYGAGRTDAGVHALGQVAHLDVESKLTLNAIPRKLNSFLPAEIHVISVEKVDAKFHARHDAVARSYIYQITKRRTAFGKELSWWIREKLDTDKMIEAANALSGFHDFISFTEEIEEQKSTQVDVNSIEIHSESELILIRVVASHFLYKMVRRLVGVIAEAGLGNLSTSEIKSFLRNPSNAPAQFTAPPSGLFLEKIYYPKDGTDWSWKDKTPPGFPNWKV